MTCYYETGELSAVSNPERAYQPFDSNRTGLVLGEGSTVLVLESAEHAIRRNAPIYGEVLAGSTTTDPDPTKGIAFERAMRQAIEKAKISPTDIDLVLPEGCGTKECDRIEAAVLSAVFGEDVQKVPMTAPKSLYGHLYGASCVTEVACSVLSMQTGKLPVMQKIEQPDPDCNFNFVTHPANSVVNFALVNSRSREGVNASFVIAANRS